MCSNMNASNIDIMVISVVIATYNGERFIEEQLKSILEQSVQPDEVIICDDCSTDKTVDKVRRLIEENGLKHWVLQENDENKGFKLNFLQGMKMAAGDIIFLCDQDDIWHPEKIRLMKECMERDQKVSLLACCYTEFTDEVPEKPFWGKSGSTDSVIIDESDQVKRVQRVNLPKNLLNVPYPGCSYCVRKTFLDKCLSYFLCNSHEPVAYEEELIALGGRTFHITARSKNPQLYRKELEEVFKEHAEEWSAVWVNVSSLANIDYLKIAKKYNIEKRIIHSHNSRNMDSKIRGVLHHINRFCIEKFGERALKESMRRLGEMI